MASAVDGEQAVVAFQFGVDILEVLAYGADADPAEPGDLLGAETVGDEHDHVAFAAGEARPLPCLVSPGVLGLWHGSRAVDPVEEVQHGLQGAGARHVSVVEVAGGAVDDPAAATGHRG